MVVDGLQETASAMEAIVVHALRHVEITDLKVRS